MYREQGAAVRTFVHRRVDPAVGDDVVAEVFLIAWRRFDRVPTDELAWLLGIARGVLANQRRGEARRSALTARVARNRVEDAQLGPESLGADSEVLQACASLGSRDQEILLLIAWDGLDRAQAARVLGISTATFAVRLHRARRRLARALAAEAHLIQPAETHSTSEVL